MRPIELSFQSELMATPSQAWEHLTSFSGISQEMMPYLRMTVPNGVESISDFEITLGEPLFQSRLFLFGLIPIGHMLLTLTELEEGAGFIEQSPMSGMRLWRHERRISASGSGCTVTDRLTFEPRWGRGIASWFVRILFDHRHNVLRRRFDAAD